MGQAAEVGGISKRFCEGNLGDDGRRVPNRFRRNDEAAAFVEFTSDGTLEIRRHFNLQFHDRLEQDRLGAEEGFSEASPGTDLECHVRRVNIVVGAVGERRLDADNGKARDRALLQ